AVVVVVALAVAGYMKFGGAEERTGRLSIAVADFQNRTQEPELDGLSGMLITAMEQSKRLSVVTRTHMFDILKQMGKADVDKIDESLGKEICSKAGIGALVTASVQKFGKLYIIDLKVLDPSKNEYLFTAKEEGEGQESIPGMLDKLSEKTRAGLKERAEEIKTSDAGLAVVTTNNMEAYQHYFKGEEYLNKLDMEKAEEELVKAVSLDSMFALAWYRLTYVLDWTTVRSGKKNDALPRALALIDRLPDKERYLLRAIAARGDADFAASVKILKEMETHYPNDKEMMYNIGDWSFHDNDLGTAAEYLNKSLAIDPTHDRALQHLTWTYRDAGQYLKMLETAGKYVEVAKSSEAFELLAAAFSLTGTPDEGLAEFSKLRTSFPGNGSVVRSIAVFYQQKGDYDSAEAGLKQFVDSTGRLRNSAAYGLIDLYSFAGRHRKVIEVATTQIERAVAGKDTAAAVNLMMTLAFADLNLTGSAKRAGELLSRTYQYNLPSSNLDYWFGKTWLEILVDPRKDIHPDMLGKVWSPVFVSALASTRNQCGEAKAAADTIVNVVPAFVEFRLMYVLADCYYRASRYNDALSALNRALVVAEMATTPWYPGAIVLMGKIYEEMGNNRQALESYQKFLKLWKQADADLPMLVDVKKRVAKLKAVSAN
ncbi:MAG TPA: tetratricopeptide repeat protein, partial [Bacteroidota bacterium]|nr:tetratricopeptide repeat protein [Bacteroidota bacterium]